jgi:hypothetical protein
MGAFFLAVLAFTALWCKVWKKDMDIRDLIQKTSFSL